MKITPKHYVGRSQTYLKHQTLKLYLEQLFGIIGQRKESVINYVDCFSGPWAEESESFEDTSIKISISEMERSAEGLRKSLNPSIRFRALFIEKNPSNFKKLQKIVEDHSSPYVTVECMCGDYTDLIQSIEQWAGSSFTFFFVDPRGYSQIDAKSLGPLLNKPNTEFLVTFMYDFLNRFVGTEQLTEIAEVLLGGSPPKAILDNPHMRQKWILRKYCGQLNERYRGLTSSIAINKPGVNRVHFFLVYLSRHPKGVIVFKKAAEKIEGLQRVTDYEAKLHKQQSKSPMADLFDSDEADDSPVFDQRDYALEAEAFLVRKLPSKPLLIDNWVWADFLEESGLFDSDLQLGMKALLQDGRVENLSADVSRRRTRFVQPNSAEKSEWWILKN